MFEIKNLVFLRIEKNISIFQITELTNYKDFVGYENNMVSDKNVYVSSVIFKKRLELHLHISDIDKIYCEFKTDGVYYDILLSFIELRDNKPYYVVHQIGEKDVEKNINYEEDIEILDEEEIHELCEEEKTKLYLKLNNLKNKVSELEDILSNPNSLSLLKNITQINNDFNKKTKKNNI